MQVCSQIKYVSRGSLREPTRRHTSFRLKAVPQVTSIPKTFKKLVSFSTGNSFREVAEVVEKPCPLPEDDEVLVRVTHAGINGACETFRARGDHMFTGNKDAGEFALGAEGSGIIVRTGVNVKTLKEGDHVGCGAMGAFSEYCITRAAKCRKVSNSGPEVAAFSLSGVAAYGGIMEACKVAPGGTVLITAAAGGLGHLAVQFAKLAGARVIATCGGERKAQALDSLGVERVINYMEEDVGDVLRREYPNGINGVLEGVGGALLRTAWDNLAQGGQIRVMGYMSQCPHSNAHEAVLPIKEGLPSAQDLVWKGMTVEMDGKTISGSFKPKDPLAIPRLRQKAFELYSSGAVKVWVDQSKSFKGIESIPDAVDYMLEGKHIGKVVVEL